MAHIFRRSASDYLIRSGGTLEYSETRPTIAEALIFAASTGEIVTMSAGAAEAAARLAEAARSATSVR